MSWWIASAFPLPEATRTSGVPEDGANALGQAVLRDGLNVPAEESSIVPPGLTGQRLDPCSRGERGAGFVEGNMPVGTDPENL